MPLINVKLIEGVFNDAQKKKMLSDLSLMEAIASLVIGVTDSWLTSDHVAAVGSNAVTGQPSRYRRSDLPSPTRPRCFTVFPSTRCLHSIILPRRTAKRCSWSAHGMSPPPASLRYSNSVCSTTVTGVI